MYIYSLSLYLIVLIYKMLCLKSYKLKLKVLNNDNIQCVNRCFQYIRA